MLGIVHKAAAFKIQVAVPTRRSQSGYSHFDPSATSRLACAIEGRAPRWSAAIARSFDRDQIATS
jgi:hypothetical protein